MIYKTESQRRQGVSSWVRRGMELGAKILYIEPPHQPPERTLIGLLQNQLDARDAVESGQIQVVLADDTAYDPAWQASVVEEALDEGYPSVRWSGEARTARSVMPRTRHVHIERATDQLCASQPVSVMCQYSAGEPVEDLGDVAKAHGAGLRERLFHTAPFEGGLAVEGEIDRSNQEILRSVLLAATSVAERNRFTVDLSGLDFLDVEGARSLLHGTAGYRQGGGLVELHSARSTVGCLIRLLGVDRARGVLMEGA